MLLRGKNLSETIQLKSPTNIGEKVRTFHTKAWSSFAPPPCRMPLGPSQASPELMPEEGSPLGFDIV
jgi:hypothetical protein